MITVQVSAQQNPIPWFSPLLAAQLSTAIYLVCAILIAVGAMTRYASLPLLILALIAQVSIQAFDTQLFWMALFGWLLIHGAGPISLDHLLRRGLEDSALPLVPRLIRGSRWISTATPGVSTAVATLAEHDAARRGGGAGRRGVD